MTQIEIDMETPSFVNPSNTVGMGNPTLPLETGEIGSGDTFTLQEKSKKKKMKSLKDYLKSKK